MVGYMESLPFFLPNVYTIIIFPPFPLIPSSLLYLTSPRLKKNLYTAFIPPITAYIQRLPLFLFIDLERYSLTHSPEPCLE